MRKRRKQNQDHGRPDGQRAHWRTRRKRSSRSNAPKKRWNVPKTNCTRQGETAEVESQAQRLRELVAQDPEKPDDVTALILLTDEVTAQLRTEQVPQTARPLPPSSSQVPRASAANRSRTASRTRSVSSGSTFSGSPKQSVDVGMTETELDQLASKYEAAPANERDVGVLDDLPHTGDRRRAA